MNPIRAIHEKAMDYAEEAVVARFRGNKDVAADLERKAYHYERQAANLSLHAPEPGRSILHRSAATLALDCDDYQEAERLACIGLLGEPPGDIAEELRDVLERVYFSRHLFVNGVELAEDEVQFSLAGRAVSYGITASAVFVERMQTLQKLVYRTAERLRDVPYRDSGRSSKTIADYNLYMSAPRAASFAVTLRFDVADGRARTDAATDRPPVFDELLDCLELLNATQEDELAERIGNAAYYRNFIALARNLAPDGTTVSQVGFTAVRDGAPRTVGFTRLQEKIPRLSFSDIGEGFVHLEGRLLGATIRSKDDAEERIKIVAADNESTTVIVPEGMMADIVRPLWESMVEVTALRTGKRTLRLHDIRQLEPVED